MSLLLLKTTHWKMRDNHSPLQLSFRLEPSREELNRLERFGHYLRWGSQYWQSLRARLRHAIDYRFALSIHSWVEIFDEITKQEIFASSIQVTQRRLQIGWRNQRIFGVSLGKFQRIIWNPFFVEGWFFRENRDLYRDNEELRHWPWELHLLLLQSQKGNQNIP